MVNEEELAEEEEDVLYINSYMRSGCRDSLVSPLQTGSYLFLFTAHLMHMHMCIHVGTIAFADARHLRHQKGGCICFEWNHHPFLTNWSLTD